MHLPFQIIDSLGRGDLSLAAALLRNNDAANGTRSSALITTTNAASDDVLPRTKDQQGVGCKACREAARSLGICLNHTLPLLLGSSSSSGPPAAGYDLEQEVGSTREIT